MHELRQAAAGMLGAMLSAIIVLGSITLALAEGGIPRAQAPAPATATNPPALPTPRPGQPTFTPSPVPPPSPTPTSAFTAFGAARAACPIPPGWMVIQVGPGETLEDIAARFNTSLEALRQGNCLSFDQLPPNVDLAVPASPTSTHTATATAAQSKPPTKTLVACVKNIPSSWVRYVIRSGDTLSSIARATNTTWQDLYWRNCLTSTTIRTGQVIYVPWVPAPTPTLPPTFTHTPPPTDVVRPSATPTPPNPATPTNTPPATETFTPAPSPTATHTPTATPPPPTDTPQPTHTPLPTDTPTPGPPDETSLLVLAM